jgi:hypothetical protein
MIGITKDEMKSRLTAHADLTLDGRELWFSDPQSQSINISLRVKEPHQLVYLARLIGHLGYEEAHFSHAYLWLTTWGVWDTQTEAIGFKAFEQIRRSYGENRSIEAAPGTYFRHDEFVESVACLLQPMLIGWDAYYIPSWSWGSLNYFVFVSHDGFVEINVRTPEMRTTVAEIFDRHDWIKSLMK